MEGESRRVFESAGKVTLGPKFLSVGDAKLLRAGIHDVEAAAKFNTFITSLGYKNFPSTVYHSEQAFYAFLRENPDVFARMMRDAGIPKGARAEVAILDLFSTRYVCAVCANATEAMMKDPKWLLDPASQALRDAKYEVHDLKGLTRASADLPFGAEPTPLAKRTPYEMSPAERTRVVEAEKSLLAEAGKGPSVCRKGL
jgi:hypothetical protein